MDVYDDKVLFINQKLDLFGKDYNELWAKGKTPASAEDMKFIRKYCTPTEVNRSTATISGIDKKDLFTIHGWKDQRGAVIGYEFSYYNDILGRWENVDGVYYINRESYNALKQAITGDTGKDCSFVITLSRDSDGTVQAHSMAHNKPGQETPEEFIFIDTVVNLYVKHIESMKKRGVFKHEQQPD